MKERGQVRTDEGRPLIAHIVFRLDYGGMENGVVNLVNSLPQAEFRHAIIALTHATEFGERITRSDVAVYGLGKRPGQDPGAYLRLYRLLRGLRPDIVHTRNTGTIDCAVVAAMAGVRTRVHGEHGWDVHDPDGTNPKYRAVRRLTGRLIRRFVAVSRDLERWLIERVGVPSRKVLRICNGVDTQRFRPAPAGEAGAGRLPSDRFPARCVVIGSVTRFSEIKDPLNLVRAFIELQPRCAAQGRDVRLLMVGDGALRPQAEAMLAAAGLGGAAWLPGSRADVAELLREMHVFALSSRREGISNTVLEAMASGLPVVATDTGGNGELIIAGRTGALVAPRESGALAAALGVYVADDALRTRHGAAARERAIAEYSLARMVRDYAALYREVAA